MQIEEHFNIQRRLDCVSDSGVLKQKHTGSIK